MNTYLLADNIISPLGMDTAENFQSARNGVSGISFIENQKLNPEPFYASLLNKNFDEASKHIPEQKYTQLERLFILSIEKLLRKIGDFNKEKTLLILSTTKGNIDLLKENINRIPSNRVEIPEMAKVINEYFYFPHPALVVSNACISGLSAILTAKKLLEMKHYEHVIVSGADLVTEFVVSGFNSLKAISNEPCKPFDKNRMGITLGEACGSVLISSNPKLGNAKADIQIVGGAQSNDANHISGPSRTGSGLILAIEKSLKSAELSPDDIAFVNAHGTATLYNDEMEAIAFHQTGFKNTYLNGLKGYFGHTLGAAGMIESIMGIEQLREQLALKTVGFDELGVSKTINVLAENKKLNKSRYFLKTNSGFGGCNASIIFEKL